MEKKRNIDESADVVVIGSGATGLAAALTAAEAGAKVILFEKQRSLGGSTNFFEGTFAVESHMQRERYITYSRDEAFKAIMEYSHWRANARIVRAFVNESAETISWLEKNGVEFIDATINLPDCPRTYHTVKGAGEAVVKSLATRAKAKGVRIHLGSPVKKIVKENGRVAGVIAEDNDEEIRFDARVIVIGTGGYTNNKQWIKKYTGYDLGINIFPLGNVDKTGDGIRMAWEAGSDKEGMGVMELFRIGPMGPEFPMKSQIQIAAIQPDLWIDPKGERFCDEGIAFNDTSVGNVNARYKEGYTWTLIDDSIKHIMIEKGISRNLAIEHPPGTRLLNIDKELQSVLEIGTGDVFSSNSIETLAEMMIVDPNVLRATVDEYNGFCAKGHDELYAKDPKFLRPLIGPTFYAFKVRTVCLGTLGGIKVNHKFEVIDKKGDPIPGLYAGGMDAGGNWGDSYPIMQCSGASSAFAFNSGRIAGKNALKYLNLS